MNKQNKSESSPKKRISQASPVTIIRLRPLGAFAADDGFDSALDSTGWVKLATASFLSFMSDQF